MDYEFINILKILYLRNFFHIYLHLDLKYHEKTGT
jgi:hypothetical protein